MRHAGPPRIAMVRSLSWTNMSRRFARPNQHSSLRSMQLATLPRIATILSRAATSCASRSPAHEIASRRQRTRSIRCAPCSRHSIPEAYIVGDLQQAIDRAKDRPSATFVTLDGDIVRGPLVIGGKTEGATPGVFSVKRQLSDLEADLGAQESRATTIATDLHA